MMIWGILGNLVSALYFLAPAPTYWRIWMDGTTGERQYWPLICTLVSTMTWMIYGILTNQVSIVYVNLFGFGAHFIYLLTFVLHGPGAKRRQINTTLLVGIFIGPITAFMFGWSADLNYVLGWVCVALNISTYAAPILTTKNALQSGSVVDMPFLVPFMLTINGASGSFLGYFVVSTIDYFVLASKILAFVVGSVQLVIYACLHQS